MEAGTAQKLRVVFAEYARRCGVARDMLEFEPCNDDNSTLGDAGVSTGDEFTARTSKRRALWSHAVKLHDDLASLALETISATRSTSNYDRYAKETLDPGGPVFRYLDAQFHRSLVRHRGPPMTAGGSGDHWRQRPELRVLKVEKVLNWRTSEQYQVERKSVLGLNRAAGDIAIPHINAMAVHGSPVNEFFLWHGAPEGTIDAICRGGFDPRRGGANAGKLFGVGSYFAENASKADRYVKPERGAPPDAHLCMILARVCLGKTHVTKEKTPSLHLPPDRDDHPAPAPSLDSVTAEVQARGGCVDYREYIVYKGAQANPEYCVWYEHAPSCMCAKCDP